MKIDKNEKIVKDKIR